MGHITVSKYEKRHTHSHDFKKSRAWHEVWNLVKNTNTLTKEKHYSIHSNVVIRSGVWICSIMSCTVKTQIKNDRMTEKWPMDEKMAAYIYLKATKYLWKQSNKEWWFYSFSSHQISSSYFNYLITRKQRTVQMCLFQKAHDIRRLIVCMKAFIRTVTQDNTWNSMRWPQAQIRSGP